jgi:hypothetical protein
VFSNLFPVLVVYVILAFYVVTSRVLGGALSITPIVVLLDIFSLCLLAAPARGHTSSYSG